MLRPILTLAVVGLAGIALWKVLWVLLLPLVGALVGFLGLALKIALIVFLVWALFRLIRGKAPEHT
jgi:predicted lipid-binding transport protein (Tim44 family)